MAVDETGPHMLPTADRTAHWERIYGTRAPQDVSWYQAEARMSLALVRRVAPDVESPIIDAGGGASTLVDGLLEAGYRHVTVLDVSTAALAHARARLGSQSASVAWLVGDVLSIDFRPSGFDVWHDRAVFHFLIDAAERQQYVWQVSRAVREGGHVIVATFANDGPEKCSGLPVVRYTPDRLAEEFGTAFRLVDSAREVHVTPAGARQAFSYSVLRRENRA
jgi:SAM-dependent methyltransferase